MVFYFMFPLDFDMGKRIQFFFLKKNKKRKEKKEIVCVHNKMLYRVFDPTFNITPFYKYVDILDVKGEAPHRTPPPLGRSRPPAVHLWGVVVPKWVDKIWSQQPESV